MLCCNVLLVHSSEIGISWKEYFFNSLEPHWDENRCESPVLEAMHSNRTLCTELHSIPVNDLTLRFWNWFPQLWSTRSPSSDNIFTWNFFYSKGPDPNNPFLTFSGPKHPGARRYTKKHVRGQICTFSWAPCVSIQQHRFLNSNFSELRKKYNFSLKIKNELSLKIMSFQREHLTLSELGERSFQNSTLLST